MSIDPIVHPVFGTNISHHHEPCVDPDPDVKFRSSGFPPLLPQIAESFLHFDQRLHGLVAEENGFQHFSFTDNVSAAFHHYHPGFRTGHDDVDVALLFDQSGELDRLEITGQIADEICRNLGDVEVDVVNLGQIPTHFAHEILQTGQLVFCTNQKSCVQFGMEILDRYADEEPWQQIGRYYLMERARKRLMLKKGKEMIVRERVENLIGYVQEMLNRLQTQQGKCFEEFSTDFLSVDASLHELQTMLEAISDIAFTPAVKRVQEMKGSRTGYAKMEAKGGWRNTVTDDLAGFIGERDSFYLGTASADGQPYIQHRGGKPGFLKVLPPVRVFTGWLSFRACRTSCIRALISSGSPDTP